MRQSKVVHATQRVVDASRRLIHASQKVVYTNQMVNKGFIVLDSTLSAGIP
jgi:hypothetical protein